MNEERHVDQGMGVESCEVLPCPAIEPESSEVAARAVVDAFLSRLEEMECDQAKQNEWWARQRAAVAEVAKRHRMFTGKTLMLMREIIKADPGAEIVAQLNAHMNSARDLFGNLEARNDG